MNRQKYMQPLIWWFTLQDMFPEPLWFAAHIHTRRQADTLKTISAFAIVTGNY